MSTADQDFFDYAITKTRSADARSWLEEIYSKYRDAPQCKSCGCTKVDIVIDPKAAIKCKDCGQWSEGITLDKIRPMDYSTVIIQKDGILKNIIKAQGAE